MKEKTIREWFQEVEDEYTRTILFEYARKRTINKLNRYAVDFGDALNYGFEWDFTREGYDFWYNICESKIDHKSFKLEKPIVPEHVEFEW